MALSLNDIRKELQEPRARQAISRAIAHQNRVRFHAQTQLTASLGQPIGDFLSFVENLLPHDKFKVFKALFRFPLQTTELTGIIFDKLARVFDGRNPVYRYKFTAPEYGSDWQQYRTEVLREPSVWSIEGWNNFKLSINSVLICDLPTEQAPGDNLPRPYFYWLPIENVISFKADRQSGAMKWIIFKQRDNRIAVFDDETFRLFEAAKGMQLWALISERAHGLGYCPARFFWSEPISAIDYDVKASPITKVLDALDWYLFYHLSKRHLDLFGSYPIYSGYEQACDYSNEENGDVCDGGFLRDRQGHYRYDAAGLMMRCPKCSNKRIIGAGSFVEVPIPIEGQPDLRNPVQMLSVDRNSLDYNTAEEERLRNNIITAVVGTSEDATTKEAINEQQVRAVFESQSSVLNHIKKGFEAAQMFVDATICRLRYGAAFVSCYVNLGTDFFLYDGTTLRNQYKAAKEAGATASELETLHERILATEYRNDPAQLNRMQLLDELEPYAHLTQSEVMELYGRGLISDADVRLKLNFTNYLRRFERENLLITEFGTALPLQTKINTILNQLYNYVNEDSRRQN